LHEAQAGLESKTVHIFHTCIIWALLQLNGTFLNQCECTGCITVFDAQKGDRQQIF